MTTKPSKRPNKTLRTPKTRDNGGKARAEALVERFLPKELPEERPYVRLVPPGVAEREENLIYLLHSALVECLECLKGTDALTWSAEFESDLALESFEAWQAAARPAKE